MSATTVTPLADATPETCGGKASALGTLLRAGFPVPDGFVVPFAAEPRSEVPDALKRQVHAAVTRMGNPPVAVRSSAADEDTSGASAAGQYQSVLAVQGPDAVVRAVVDCRRSASSARVADYRARTGGDDPTPRHIAVLVQRLVDADVSGVMFTPAGPGESTRIEASWGLGLAVVDGTVTPDSYRVEPNGTVQPTVGAKTVRTDRDVVGVSTRDVPTHQRNALTLDDATAAHLAALGGRVAEQLGSPQDIEWAIAGHTTWLLQARPVTAPLPPVPRLDIRTGSRALRGTPGSHGTVTGNARIVHGPNDFGRVHAGDILVCPYTDPAWTPLFTIAAGVVTETGGALSHAAIVAREYGIPAVLGVTGALELVPDGATVTLDGTTGTLTVR